MVENGFKIPFCKFYFVYTLFLNQPCLSGSPTSKLSTASQASQGTGSPIPKIHGSSFVTSAVKVMLLLHFASF